MGLGFGVKCERCGTQLSYDMRNYLLKQDGDDYDLCEDCVLDFKKSEWDKKNLSNNSRR